MGRKIPAKKHRGVKDPLVQQAKRWQILKGKINAPPRDPDEQPVPKSLQRLFASAARPGAARRAARGKRASAAASASASGSGSGSGALPRLPGERARTLSRRVAAATRALLLATDDDDAPHYPVEHSDDEEEPHPPRRAIAASAASLRQPRADKRQRRKERLHAKRQHQHQQLHLEASSRPQYERVPFGECAHAPPALPKPRTRLDHDPLRPGRRDLLLAALLRGRGEGRGEGDGERRSQSESERERQREAAVAAYRALKADTRRARATRTTIGPLR